MARLPKRSAGPWPVVALLAVLAWVTLSVVSHSWYIVALPFAAISALISAFNLACAAKAMRGKKAPSPVLLMSSFFGLIVVQIGRMSGEWGAWPALVLVLVDAGLTILPVCWAWIARR